MRKVLKYSAWIVGGLIGFILVVLLLVSLLIQIQPVKDRLARFAEKKASETINGELSIGQLNGNFFSSLKLSNVVLVSQNDTMAQIEELELHYNLWPLLDGKLMVESARIAHPYFYLEQHPDSTWNVQHITTTKTAEKDTTSNPSNFEIEIARFQLEEGDVVIISADTIIPRRVQHINTKLALYFSSASQQLDLTDFSVTTRHPDFKIEQLSFNFERDSDAMQLSDFQLKTVRNELEGKARFDDAPQRRGEADLNSGPLEVSEFNFFIPGIKLPANPVLMFNAKMEQDAIMASLDLSDQQQKIHFDVRSANLADFLFEQTTAPLEYEIDGMLENINLAHWLGDPGLKYLINGKLTVDGKGVDPKTATIKVVGDFKDLMINERPVDKLDLNVDLADGNLDGVIEGHGDFGTFYLEPTIRNWQTEPVYELDLMTEKLDLAPLLGNDSLQSNINLKGTVNGHGFDPKTLRANAELYLSESSLREVKVDTLVANVTYQKENIQIDSLRLQTESLRVKAEGNYSLNANSDITLQASFDDIEEFSAFIPLENFNTSGELEAHLLGTADSLNIDTRLELGETSLQDLSIQHLLVNGHGKLTKQDTIFQGRVSAYDFLTGGFNLDSIAFDVETTTDSVFIDGQVANEDLQTTLQAGMRFAGDPLRISLNQWEIDYKKQHLELLNPPAVFEMDSVTYRLDELRLASGIADSSQYLLAKGTVSRQGAEDFTLKVVNIDIARLLELLDQELNANGNLNINFSLGGTAQSPTLQGNFDLKNAVLNEYKFTTLGGTIDYANNQFNVDVDVTPQDSGQIKLTGLVPFELTMDSMAVKFNPKDSIDVNLTIDRFPLAVLQTVNLAENIKGELQGSVNVQGTVEQPDPKGDLRLKNASVNIPEYGIDYREIRFKLNFLRNQAVLDTMLIRTEDGKLTGTGQIDFSSDFYKGDVSDSEIRLIFDHFNPVNHDQFNLEVVGDVTFGGIKDSVKFNGDLNIPQGEIYLPAVFNMLGRMTVPDMPKPILLRELESLERAGVDTLSIAQIDSTQTDSISFNYLEGLTGEVQVKIPKNTWIKNEDMHVEISGDLEVIKNPDFMELFGTVEIVRGQYDLLGKTFMIEKGSVSFQGGEEMIPRMDISANYNFRNVQRVQQELNVQISGTPEDPEVNFTLDGSTVSEGDALSYILFGKSMNELTMDQQQNVSGAGDIAGKAAASILSSQLTGFLSDKLDVDYIEVKSEGSFENATVTVGKYITNDLFVSYEQRFGETDEKDIAKYEVKLEYELFRFLFFQLNNSSKDSGFDVIFKFDAE